MQFVKFFWRKGIHQKVSFILWDNFYNSLTTLSMLKHRGVNIQSDLCNICKNGVESPDHFFIHCDYAIKVWNYFTQLCHVGSDTIVTVLDLFVFCNGVALQGRCKKVWDKLIYVGMWHLWNERNSKTFGGRRKLVEELCLNIKQTLVLWLFENDVFKELIVNQLLFNWETALHV